MSAIAKLPPPAAPAQTPPAATDAMQAMLAEIARLKSENAKLAAKADSVTVGRLNLKVSEKGGLSVYGLSRFPLTLYKGQWKRVIESIEAIKAFLAENDAKLADKK